VGSLPVTLQTCSLTVGTEVESAKREILQGLLAAGGDVSDGMSHLAPVANPIKYEKSLSDTCDLENQKDAATLGTSMVEFCIAKVDAVSSCFVPSSVTKRLPQAMLYDGNSDVAMSFIRGLIGGSASVQTDQITL
jgi:hypothetical protein